MEEQQLFLFDEEGEPAFSQVTDKTADAGRERNPVAVQADITRVPPKAVKADSGRVFDESLRLRSHNKQLSVTFSDGTTCCKTSATATFIEVLQYIGAEKVASVGLEVSHYPMVLKEVPVKYKDYCKPLGEGWYVNLFGSDAGIKHHQLRAISEKLKLNLKIETGTGLAKPPKDGEKVKMSVKRTKEGLAVKFPDGTCIDNQSPIQTYMETIRRFGVDMLQRKGLEMGGKTLVTSSKMYNNQVEMGKNQWLTVPPLTKGKITTLRTLAAILRQPIEVSVKG